MCLHACLHHHNALFLLYSPNPLLSISSKLFLCLCSVPKKTQRSTTTTAESPATTATPKHNTHSQIWSHTFLQTYGTNLPTSLTYFLLFHQRLLTSETCCGLRYGLASLSTTSVTHAPQKHTSHQLCSSRFSRRNHNHSSTTTMAMSPLPHHHAILHFLPLLQSIHFLGTPSMSSFTSITKATKVKAQTNRGLLTKDNFYGNGDCCRGIPSCCHPSPGHTTSNTNNHHTSLHSTCQHHTSCHPNTNPRYVILNTFPFHSPASPTKRPLLFPRVAPTLQHRLTLGCLPFP